MDSSFVFIVVNNSCIIMGIFTKYNSKDFVSRNSYIKVKGAIESTLVLVVAIIITLVALVVLWLIAQSSMSHGVTIAEKLTLAIKRMMCDLLPWFLRFMVTGC